MHPWLHYREQRSQIIIIALRALLWPCCSRYPPAVDCEPSWIFISVWESTFPKVLGKGAQCCLCYLTLTPTLQSTKHLKVARAIADCKTRMHTSQNATWEYLQKFTKNRNNAQLFLVARVVCFVVVWTMLLPTRYITQKLSYPGVMLRVL